MYLYERNHYYAGATQSSFSRQFLHSSHSKHLEYLVIQHGAHLHRSPGLLGSSDCCREQWLGEDTTDGMGMRSKRHESLAPFLMRNRTTGIRLPATSRKTCSSIRHNCSLTMASGISDTIMSFSTIAGHAAEAKTATSLSTKRSSPTECQQSRASCMTKTSSSACTPVLAR